MSSQHNPSNHLNLRVSSVKHFDIRVRPSHGLRVEQVKTTKTRGTPVSEDASAAGCAKMRLEEYQVILLSIDWAKQAARVIAPVPAHGVEIAAALESASSAAS